MKRCTHFILASVLCGFLFAGCSPIAVDQPQFDATLSRLDKFIRAIDEAIAKITTESASWREALGKLEKDVKGDAQDVLGNDVKNVLRSIEADLGDQPKIAADYIEVKLKDN